MTRARSDRLLASSAFVLLASFCLFWFSHTIADPDLWGHIRFGQDILRTGSIIQVDTYSYRTGERPWINHEWLSEVIFAGLYDLSGPAGLLIFKVAVSLLLLGLCHAQLRRRGLGPFCSVLLLLLISFPFRLGLGTIRPQILTYLLFLFQLLLIENVAPRRAYRLWVLPIVYACWVNLHGGVLAGIGVLGLWIAVRIVERIWGDTRSPIQKVGAVVEVTLLGVACGVALLINPYRATLVEFLLRTATVSRPEIGEWSPLALLSLPGQVYLGLLAIGILGLVFTTRSRQPGAILIFSVTAVLPLVSQRHYPLFALALAVLAGEHIADVWNRRRLARMQGAVRQRAVAAISLFLSLLFVGFSLPRFDCIRVEPYYFAFPARAVALLKKSGIHGNMAVPFDWGEYVLWHLGPGLKVSIDGRRETLYSDETYRQSRDFERGTGDWNALLKTSIPDLVLVPIGSPTVNLLRRADGWVPLYHDTFCVLFAREGLPSLGQIVASPIPALPDNGDGLCFPAPR